MMQVTVPFQTANQSLLFSQAMDVSFLQPAFRHSNVGRPLEWQGTHWGGGGGGGRGDSLFNVRVPASDPLSLFRSEFVSTYQIGDHIYFFIRERAYEVDNGQTVVYSRTIRICKNDNGQVRSSDNTPFLTYQKARMACSYNGERGSLPYNYENLEFTFLWNSSAHALTLYGIFSSPDNEPEGGTICKFSFDETDSGRKPD